MYFLKNKIVWVLIIAIILIFNSGSYVYCDDASGDICVKCHTKITPGIVNQWNASKHSKNGVTCYECHQADEKDKDAFKHMGKTISIIVSPKDCSKCHEKEFEEQKGSHHAKAAEILGSLDNLLGEILSGEPVVNAGCRQCHGSKVQIDKDGKPTQETWPNTGMGRINPDGSKGSCAACHARHEFSVAQARQPESCGKCHLGPDHPQIEVWNESKHGILYHANREKMNLDKDEWIAGKDYFSGPTCASCHMSAAGKQEVTHDVGERISWTLRPPISVKLNMLVFDDNSKEDIPGENPKLPAVGDKYKLKNGEEKVVKKIVKWKDRRNKMQNVCSQCHDKNFVKGAYKQFDDVVDLYNTKFASPAKSIISELRSRGIISADDFDDRIEWIWWELWHHEGRRARHGAAMQGPDYTFWHGMYEVSKHFYEEFIPELKKVAGEKVAAELLEKYVYPIEGHKWYKEGLSKETKEKIKNYYKERYKQ